MATPEGTNEQQIDVKQWLKDNKLSDVEDTFIKRNIAIEELLEFEQDDLK